MIGSVISINNYALLPAYRATSKPLVNRLGEGQAQQQKTVFGVQRAHRVVQRVSCACTIDHWLAADSKLCHHNRLNRPAAQRHAYNACIGLLTASVHAISVATASGFGTPASTGWAAAAGESCLVGGLTPTWQARLVPGGWAV